MNRSCDRRTVLKTAALPFLAPMMSCAGKQASAKPPNFVIIFLDDSGWSDFRPFGDHGYPTPNVENLAREGCCYHNFHVPQAVCSASRASLLSGCYPGRTKVFSAHPPRARGLDPSYATLGEVLGKAGYSTGVFGKWHIGDQPETRPPARGFDESCGLMYSNDMWEFHPENPEYWGKYPLQFWENGEVSIDRVTPKEQKMLTTWYTEHAVDFIGRHREGPFLLYVPHSMPHVPLFCSDKYRDKSGKGLYADVMMELDWSVGQIMNALKTNGLGDDTVVIMTSDNGPWISYGNHAGKTPFREAKGTGFDGGTRSACIIRYPGQIAPGTVSQDIFCSTDILPTLCHLAGAALPGNEIDGGNVWDIIRGKEGAVNPNRYYPFSTGKNFEGVLSTDGKWKLHLPHQYRTLVEAGHDGAAGKYEMKSIELSLFDMQNDQYETTNVIDSNPGAAERLLGWATEHKRRFYDET